MYYVQLEMSMSDGTLTHIGTSCTRDLSKATSQLEAYREVAEGLVTACVVNSYELKLGTIPNALQ